MLGTPSSFLQFDPEIEKTARANRKAVRLAKEAEKRAAFERNISEEEEASEEVFEE
ncbi:hypothetical protein A2U01_0090578, partial [Trifolium medium]|nr:hypothetical protein [Trifolium medium]